MYGCNSCEESLVRRWLSVARPIVNHYKKEAQCAHIQQRAGAIPAAPDTVAFKLAAGLA